MPNKYVCMNLKDDHDLIEGFAQSMRCTICLLSVASFTFVTVQRRIRLLWHISDELMLGKKIVIDICQIA